MPSFTASDGARLFYRDEGRGTPILFLHGWMMSSRLWDRTVAALSPRRRCLALDLRGCGESEARPGTHRMDRFADDAHDLLRHLDMPRATLVGWSMGGGIVMRYLDRHGSDRVAGVALIDFPPHFQEDPSVAPKVAARLRSDRRAFLMGFLKRMFHAQQTAEREAWIVAEAERCHPETAIEMYGELGVGDARGRRYDLPALLVFPEHGWYAPSVEEWKRVFPDHAAPSFPASRHAPFLEEPEAFARALEAFTTARSGAKPATASRSD